MRSGELRCPNCHNPGMSNYYYYDSIQSNGNLWFFYNIDSEVKTWKCWALLYACGSRPKHWYDPCGWCFNPCDYTPDVVTTVNGVEVNRAPDGAIGICCCMIFLCVCYLIYGMYASLFFWYDLYYFFCKPVKEYKIIFIGNGEMRVEIDSYYWVNNNYTHIYTEQFYCDNFPNLFYCTRCNYHGKTFREFMAIKELSSNFPVPAHQPTSVDIMN